MRPSEPTEAQRIDLLSPDNFVGELAWMPSNFISGQTRMPVAFDVG